MSFIANSKGLFNCPCCGFFTLPLQPPNSFEICPVCFWEDDGLQYANPQMDGGANPVSLQTAKQNYAKFGAIRQEDSSFVRTAKKHERNR